MPLSFHAHPGTTQAVSSVQSASKIFGLNPFLWIFILFAAAVIAGGTIAFVALRGMRKRVAEQAALRTAMGLPGYQPPPPQYRAPSSDPQQTATDGPPPTYGPPPSYGPPPGYRPPEQDPRT